MSEKVCNRCGTPKPVGEFYRDKTGKDGLRSWCKECHRAQMRIKRPEYEARADKTKARARSRRKVLSQYGITPDRYEALLSEQDGRCAICGTDRPSLNRETMFFVDHDHQTGAVRGLLCTNCNTGLGKFGDDPDRIRAAIAYLAATSSK